MSLPMMTMWYSSSTLKELVLHLNVVVLGTDEEPAREDDDDESGGEEVFLANSFTLKVICISIRRI